MDYHLYDKRQPPRVMPKATTHKVSKLLASECYTILLCKYMVVKFSVCTLTTNSRQFIGHCTENTESTNNGSKNEHTEPHPTLRQDLKRPVEVLCETRIQVVGHVRGVDLDVGRRVHQDQPKVSAARQTSNCSRSQQVVEQFGRTTLGHCVRLYLVHN